MGSPEGSQYMDVHVQFDGARGKPQAGSEAGGVGMRSPSAKPTSMHAGTGVADQTQTDRSAEICAPPEL